MGLVRLTVWMLLLAGAVGIPADAQTPVCVVARACGHSDCCVFTADVALPLLVPKQQ